MFENYKTFKTTFAGRELMVETGKVCGLANGSCWVHYGETLRNGKRYSKRKAQRGC